MSLDLMEMHVEALFRLDPERRIVAVNQAGGAPAPRLFLGRTLRGNVYRLHRSLPDPLAAELEAILAGEPVASDLSEPAWSFQGLHDTLVAHAPVERVWQGSAWRFPDQIEPGHGIETALVEDPGVVQRWFPWLARELASGVTESLPCAAVVQDGDAVSICFCSRTSDRASEAGVETADAFRERGYATAAVAAWAQAVRAEGREPLYSTSWDNHPSRAVARRLGLILYGVDLHFS